MNKLELDFNSLSRMIFILKSLDGLLDLLFLLEVLALNAGQLLQLPFKQFIFLLDFLKFYALGLITVGKLVQAH